MVSWSSVIVGIKKTVVLALLFLPPIPLRIFRCPDNFLLLPFTGACFFFFRSLFSLDKHRFRRLSLRRRRRSPTEILHTHTTCSVCTLKSIL